VSVLAAPHRAACRVPAFLPKSVVGIRCCSSEAPGSKELSEALRSLLTVIEKNDNFDVGVKSELFQAVMKLEGGSVEGAEDFVDITGQCHESLLETHEDATDEDRQSQWEILGQWQAAHQMALKLHVPLPAGTRRKQPEID
jgi:hypothetical protein